MRVDEMNSVKLWGNLKITLRHDINLFLVYSTPQWWIIKFTYPEEVPIPAGVSCSNNMLQCYTLPYFLKYAPTFPTEELVISKG